MYQPNYRQPSHPINKCLLYFVIMNKIVYYYSYRFIGSFILLGLYHMPSMLIIEVILNPKTLTT